MTAINCFSINTQVIISKKRKKKNISTRNRSPVYQFQQFDYCLFCCYAEMPTFGNLKSGDFSSIKPRHRTTTPPPPPPQEKSNDRCSPSNRPQYPQIDLELPMFTVTSQREKRKKISEVFRGLPQLTQS